MRNQMSQRNVTKDNATPGEFRTPDLYFAAYLQVAGVEMKRTERENNRVFFVFDTTIANMDELKTSWFNNTGKVPGQPYAHAVKSLKSVCHMG
jgi:hypothetical protein